MSTLDELVAADLTGKIALLHGELVAEPLSAKSWFLRGERDDAIIAALEAKRPAAVLVPPPPTPSVRAVHRRLGAGAPRGHRTPGDHRAHPGPARAAPPAAGLRQISRNRAQHRGAPTRHPTGRCARQEGRADGALRHAHQHPGRARQRRRRRHIAGAGRGAARDGAAVRPGVHRLRRRGVSRATTRPSPSAVSRPWRSALRARSTWPISRLIRSRK